MIELHEVAEVVVEYDDAAVNEDLAAGFILLGVTSTKTGFQFLLGTAKPPAAPAAAPDPAAA